MIAHSERKSTPAAALFDFTERLNAAFADERLNPTDYKVYYCFIYLFKEKNMHCCSYEEIASACRVSKRTALRSIKKLGSCNYIIKIPIYNDKKSFFSALDENELTHITDKLAHAQEQDIAQPLTQPLTQDTQDIAQEQDIAQPLTQPLTQDTQDIAQEQTYKATQPLFKTLQKLQQNFENDERARKCAQNILKTFRQINEKLITKEELDAIHDHKIFENSHLIREYFSDLYLIVGEHDGNTIINLFRPLGLRIARAAADQIMYAAEKQIARCTISYAYGILRKVKKQKYLRVSKHVFQSKTLTRKAIHECDMEKSISVWKQNLELIKTAQTLEQIESLKRQAEAKARESKMNFLMFLIDMRIVSEAEATSLYFYVNNSNSNIKAA